MDAANRRAAVETMHGLGDPNITTRPRCCCGRPDCAYLEHNNTALGGLERDLETAARLGQALLSRHESYITDSQAEHERLSSYISELESERTSLQNANEKIVAENRNLLFQLEGLNASLATSDEEVRRLEDLLMDCELEVKRLNGLVRKTEEFNGRLQEMEKERLSLMTQVDESHQDVRNTMARWRESERRIRELEDDLQRIEREARLDRTRHEEIVARLDKERSLERELGTAEGRLKGAAAFQGVNSDTTGSKSVVSHFVRDILQDNASLQAGIEELKELLQTSNEEVQNLREQIMSHQPLDDTENSENCQQLPSLDEQMSLSQATPQQLSKEVHVHHHYHTKVGKKDKPAIVRRPSRKRAIIPTPSYPSETWASSTTSSKYARKPLSPVATNGHQPQSSKNRWSMQSTATSSTFLSSMPSSPRSYFDRGGSIFDRLEQGEESSRPTSPESVGDFIPSWQQYATKTGEPALEDFEEETTDEVGNVLPQHDILESTITPVMSEDDPLIAEPPVSELTPKPSIIIHNTIDDSTSIPTTSESNVDGGMKQVQRRSSLEMSQPGIVTSHMPELRPSLARSASHESLVSISGMDIHIAKRPSPTSTLKLLRGNSSHFAQSPSQTRKLSASQPLASVTEYTVLSSPVLEISHGSAQPLRRLPSGIEALSGIAVPAPRASNASSPTSSGLGRLVGGWVRGRWGMAPTKSNLNTRTLSTGSLSVIQTLDLPPVSENTSSAILTPDSTRDSEPVDRLLSVSNRPTPSQMQTSPSILQTTEPKFDLSLLFAGRSPGINQPGVIPGFRAAAMSKRTPSEIQATVIDEEGLRDCLAE